MKSLSAITVIIYLTCGAKAQNPAVTHAGFYAQDEVPVEADPQTDLFNLTPGDEQIHYLWFTYEAPPDVNEIGIGFQPREGANDVNVAYMLSGEGT